MLPRNAPLEPVGQGSLYRLLIGTIFVDIRPMRSIFLNQSYNLVIVTFR